MRGGEVGRGEALWLCGSVVKGGESKRLYVTPARIGIVAKTSSLSEPLAD